MAPLRVRHPKGVATLNVDINSDASTVQDLQQEILKVSDILPSQQNCACSRLPACSELASNERIIYFVSTSRIFGAVTTGVCSEDWLPSSLAHSYTRIASLQSWPRSWRSAYCHAESWLGLFTITVDTFEVKFRHTISNQDCQRPPTLRS